MVIHLFADAFETSIKACVFISRIFIKSVPLAAITMKSSSVNPIIILLCVLENVRGAVVGFKKLGNYCESQTKSPWKIDNS